MKALIATFLCLTCTLAYGQACHRATILEPSPFLGTEEEIIVLSDGSVWKDLSYKYLYLYAYNPSVIICPGQGKMTLQTGGQEHVFSLMPMGERAKRQSPPKR